MYKEKAVDYFDRHPSSDECHITSDGRVFHLIGTAQGFASGLRDNKIESYKRSDVDVKNIEVKDPMEETGSTGAETGTGEVGDGNSGTDDAKIQAIEALRNFDASTAEYPEIKALVKALELVPASQQKLDLLAALTTAKANLEPQE